MTQDKPPQLVCSVSGSGRFHSELLETLNRDKSSTFFQSGAFYFLIKGAVKLSKFIEAEEEITVAAARK